VTNEKSLEIVADGKKIIVVSDVHLTDRFNPGKFADLERVIGQADLVVLNGDFWDGFQINYPDFVESDWNQLFDLLKSKNTIYLYGNHDPQSYGDGTEFSVAQSDRLVIRQKGVVFNFQHGNRIDPSIEDRIHFPRWFLGLGNKLEGVMVMLLGKNYLRRYRRGNQTMKIWKAHNIQPDEWLVCGHSHFAEVSLENKFANSGLANWGFVQYLEIENGAVSLKNV